MKRVLANLTYANTMATILAFLVLAAGSAYAIDVIKIVPKKNSVGAKQLADAAITSSKLASAAVRTPNFADGGVTSTDLANGAVGHEKLDLVTQGAYAAPDTYSRTIRFTPGRCDGSTTTGCEADVLSVPGLTLHASCYEDFGTQTEHLEFSVTSNDGVVNYSYAEGTAPDGTVSGEYQGGFPGTGSVFGTGGFVVADGEQGRRVGKLVFAHGTTHLVLTLSFYGYAAHVAGDGGGQHRCELVGRAVVA